MVRLISAIICFLAHYEFRWGQGRVMGTWGKFTYERPTRPIGATTVWLALLVPA